MAPAPPTDRRRSSPPGISPAAYACETAQNPCSPEYATSLRLLSVHLFSAEFHVRRPGRSSVLPRFLSALQSVEWLVQIAAPHIFDRVLSVVINRQGIGEILFSPFLVILDYLLQIVDPVLIDVSRLVYRRLAAHLPTGVDRVSLAYLRHFSGRARAVVSLGSFSSVLSIAESELAFEALLDGRTQDRATAIRIIAEAVLRGLGGLRVADQVLLNTGHLGIEHNSYLVQLRRRGVRPVFMVHDLIPITHPEYCRPGEMDRHVARVSETWSPGDAALSPIPATRWIR